MVWLARGTAITIATLLCVPDAVALIPSAPSVLVLLVRVGGLWLSAFTLWWIGFTGILLGAAWVSGGIVLDEEGFKLWRRGRKVKWSDVQAVVVEEQPLFSAAFVVRPVARRLTVYERAKGGALKPHNIPSLSFKSDAFDRLYAHICQRSLGTRVSGPALVCNPNAADELKTTCSRGAGQRKLLSVIILIGLCSFLGRKALLNYNFNCGSKAFRQENYAQAESFYAQATMVEPWFPSAWDQLARSEYRQGKLDAAGEHWKRALACKPDLVEAKVGLSQICLRKGDIKRARQLLEQSVRLAPRYAPALINLAQLYLVIGEYNEADRLINLIKVQGLQTKYLDKLEALVAAAKLKGHQP